MVLPHKIHHCESTTFTTPKYAPEVDEWIAEHASIDNSNVTHVLRSAIFRLKVKDIKRLYIHTVEAINRHEISKLSHKHFMYVVKDLCLHKIRSCIPSKLYNNKHFMPITFVNKLVENVKMNGLFKKESILNSFPVKDCAMAIPTISFSRDEAIGTKVLNYNRVVKNSTSQPYVCACGQYPDKFRNPHHGHIVTGDLDLVTHNGLMKGLKYHDQQPPNKNVAFNSIESGIDSYVTQVSAKLKVPITQFSEWKSKLKSAVKLNLDRCKKYQFNNVLSQSGPKDALRKLQDDFPIVPVDKASYNVSFVCKAYYMEILSHEITVSGTFARSNLSSSQVVSDIKQSKYVNAKDDPNKLPTLYATTKMHKDPPSFRFIKAGRETVLQNLSENVGKCLKKLIQISKSYAQYRIKEIDNCVFIIDNRDVVIKFLCAENYDSHGKKQLSTWDFSTLYTKIPHYQLKNNVEWFIRKVFSFMDKEFINSSSTGKKAYFSIKRRGNSNSFNMQELIEAVFFIIDNSYISFLDEIFRQIIGIPMGTNCAPHLANIYLHVYEYKYISKLVNRGHIELAKKLSNVFRYQDDCIAIDDDGLFASHASHIYPPEMILKNTNISPNKSTFLDLTVSIYRQKFLYYSWDKRRDFNFRVVSYPNLAGNIPSSQAYGVYTSQLVRFCEINMTFGHFLSDIKTLTDKFTAQSFESGQLRKKLTSFWDTYFFKWAKYDEDISSCLNKIFGIYCHW